MAAPMNTSSFAKALWPGVKTWYGREYAEFPVEYSKIFETAKSNQAWEEDVGISSFGLAQRKPEGDGITYDSEEQAFVTRYIHGVWALGFVITRELYEDNLYPQVISRRAPALAFSMRQTKEINGWSILNNAFSTSHKVGDGSALCATDHANFSGYTAWANKPTIDTDISTNSLEQACIDISKWRNDRGLKISIMPERLIIPYDSVFDVERILKSPSQPGTANNDVNALYTTGKFPGGIVVSHYLTDTNAWFIQTNAKNGLKLYQRRPMEFGVDNDFDTENAKYKATERYVFGVTDPRNIYGSSGS